MDGGADLDGGISLFDPVDFPAVWN